VPHDKAVQFTEVLLSNPDVKLVGLAARDSLRLEAGLCLYGNDIDEDTTPVAASLTWVIGKRRRQAGGFPGAAIIQQELKTGASRKRVGLVLSQGIARPGTHESPTVIQTSPGNIVGHVTSGTFSPMLGKGIAMGYVSSNVKTPAVEVVVRGKPLPATITKMPFVPARFHRVPATSEKTNTQ
jgi:aminomethyltransferase